jgi:hypothetical protein
MGRPPGALRMGIDDSRKAPEALTLMIPIEGANVGEENTLLMVTSGLPPYTPESRPDALAFLGPSPLGPRSVRA